MLVNLFFEGMQVKKSSKGTEFAILYLKSMKADGTPDFKQERLNTFNAETISACSKLKFGDIATFDITIKDGLVESVVD